MSIYADMVQFGSKQLPLATQMDALYSSLILYSSLHSRLTSSPLIHSTTTVYTGIRPVYGSLTEERPIVRSRGYLASGFLNTMPLLHKIQCMWHIRQENQGPPPIGPLKRLTLKWDICTRRPLHICQTYARISIQSLESICQPAKFVGRAMPTK